MRQGGRHELTDELLEGCRPRETKAPQEVTALEGYEAVVLGSAVYAGRWLEAARAFADRHAAELATRLVWLFSSGPAGDPLKPQDEAPEALKLADRLRARGHRTFARTPGAEPRAPDGDFRDREDVMAWSGEIVAELAREQLPE